MQAQQLTIIILCAGKEHRWGGHLGVAKHMVPIDGEALLHRTVRLVRERGSADIHVARFSGYAIAGVRDFAPAHGPVDFVDTDKLLSTMDLWSRDARTVLLNGDVYFTEAAMDTILGYKGDCAMFARPGPSRITGKPWAEEFAWSFLPPAGKELLPHIHAVKRELVRGNIARGGNWEVYRSWRGMTPLFRPGPVQDMGEGFVVIDDETEDFDFPVDYEEWIWRHRNRRRHGDGTTVILQVLPAGSEDESVQLCVDSVRRWARTRGYRHQLMQYDPIDVLPQWIRKRIAAQPDVLDELARMHLVRNALSSGAVRAAWLPVDTLILDDHASLFDDGADHGVTCQHTLSSNGRAFEVTRQVSSLAFWASASSPQLPFWIDALEMQCRHRMPGPARDIAPLHTMMRWENVRLMDTLGLMTPEVFAEASRGSGTNLAVWSRMQPGLLAVSLGLAPSGARTCKPRADGARTVQSLLVAGPKFFADAAASISVLATQAG